MAARIILLKPGGDAEPTDLEAAVAAVWDGGAKSKPGEHGSTMQIMLRDQEPFIHEDATLYPESKLMEVVTGNRLATVEPLLATGINTNVELTGFA